MKYFMSVLVELKRMEKDLEGMKAQAEGLAKEYDRILDENEKMQVCKKWQKIIFDLHY